MFPGALGGARSQECEPNTVPVPMGYPEKPFPSAVTSTQIFPFFIAWSIVTRCLTLHLLTAARDEGNSCSVLKSKR